MAAESSAELWREKDGRSWRIGGDREIAWIRDGTQIGPEITSAIPPVFKAYATLEQPGTGNLDWESPQEDQHRHDQAVLGVLQAHTPKQPWWLGFLEKSERTDVIFSDVPKVSTLETHNFVLVEAGPEQAATWRAHEYPFRDVLPDLMFPQDRSWLAQTLWDDDWTCLGGSRVLIGAVLASPELGHRAHEIESLTQRITPPGHTMI
jgi:hypothetical protein